MIIPDLSLHILDIAENSIKAGADLIEITVDEDVKNNSLTIGIRDNGKGMSREFVNNIKETNALSGTERKSGLGLPLFKQAADMAGGKLEIESGEGKGTVVKASFVYNHINRKPVGNIAGTLIALLANDNDTDIKYKHKKDGKEFFFDSREIRKELGINSIKDSRILIELKELINSKLKEIS